MKKHKSDLCAYPGCFGERQDHHADDDGHAFVEPSPPPPTENAKCPQCPHLHHATNACNGDAQSGHRCLCLSAQTESARAGADEHDEIARIFVTGWARVVGINQANQERMISQLASQLRGAHSEGLAAGRARGIEEERKRCHDIVIAKADGHSKFYSRGFVSTKALFAVAEEIAKENT